MSQPPQSPTFVIAAMQSEALEAIKNGQAATLEAVKQWNDNLAKITPNLPSTPELPTELKANLGSPSEIIDSVYDFAGQLLELNKQFVHQLLEASTLEK